MSYVKIGVAGPVGSGKTALIEALSRMSINAAKAAARTTKKITIVNMLFSPI